MAKPSNQTREREGPTALAKRQAEVQDQIMAGLDNIQQALPRYLAKAPDRFARIVLNTITANPDLLACKPESLMACILEMGSMGLMPGPYREAYLVPYKGVCTLIPGYIGYMKLARNTGKVTRFDGHVVLPGDAFEIELGLAQSLHHVPKDLEGRDPNADDWIGAYTIARMNPSDPMADSFHYLSRANIEHIRKSSMAWVNKKHGTPWFTHPGEMRFKSTARQHCKRLDLSDDMRLAVHFDELADVGKEQPLDYALADDALAGNVTHDPTRGAEDATYTEPPKDVSQEIPSDVDGETGEVVPERFR